MNPVCEDCLKEVTNDEVIESLGRFGYIMCHTCLDIYEAETEEEDY